MPNNKHSLKPAPSMRLLAHTVSIDVGASLRDPNKQQSLVWIQFLPQKMRGFQQ